jgi:hypothetical protein
MIWKWNEQAYAVQREAEALLNGAERGPDSGGATIRKAGRALSSQAQGWNRNCSRAFSPTINDQLEEK